MKLKKMSLALLVAVMIVSSGFTVFGQATSLPDVVGTPYAEAVNQLASDGLINGYSDGNFYPAKQITRAEACKIVAAALGIKDASTYKSSFSDLAGYGWAEGYIGYAVEAGVVVGYPDGTFKPGNKVTEKELITMLVRALGYADSDLPGSWPGNFVNKAKDLGITAGTEFGTVNYASRGMTALLTYNAFYKVNTFSKTDQLGVVIDKTNPSANGLGQLVLMNQEGMIVTLKVPAAATVIQELTSGDIAGYSAGATGTITGLTEKKTVYASEKTFTLSAAYSGITIDSDAAIFTFGESGDFGPAKATFTADSQDYGVKSQRLMRSVTSSAYYVLENSRITAMIVPSDVGYSGRMYGLIKDIGTARNLDGEVVAFVDLLIGEDTVTMLTNGRAGLPGESLYAASGELFQLTLRNGVIMAIADALLTDPEDLGVILPDSNDFGTPNGTRFVELTPNEFRQIVTYEDGFAYFTDMTLSHVQQHFGIMEDVVVYEINDEGDYIPADAADIEEGSWIRGYDVTDDDVDYADLVVIGDRTTK